MKYVIVGLGNPGSEYANTRHNMGRLSVEYFEQVQKFGGFVDDRKTKSELTKGKVGKHLITLSLPNTFMNKSGSSVKQLVTNIKMAESMVVIHDDIDIPFGKIRISFGRGSGGHKGVESIIRAVKTKNFIRIRVGVAPTTKNGKVKKPVGEENVYNFLLGKFNKKEIETMNNVFKTTNSILESIIAYGRVKAMNRFN